MKTLIVSLAALAVVSGAALASDRSGGLRDSDTYFGKFATRNMAKGYSNSASSSAALAVGGNAGSLTAYERMMQISEDSEHGSDGQNHNSIEK